MGLVGSQARVIYLKSRDSDLQFKLLQNSNRRMRLLTVSDILAERQNTVMNLAFSKSENGSSNETQADQESAILEQQQKMIENAEKQLDMEMKNLETQIKMVEQELESAQKMLDKNIQLCTYKIGQ